MSMAPYPNYYSYELGFPSYFLATCVFMLAIFNEKFSLLLNKKTFLFLGAISYPLYSCHLVIIEIMSHKLPYGGLIGFTFRCVIISLGLSYIIHKIVEKPAQNWSKLRIQTL